jgi:hypothetical protein
VPGGFKPHRRQRAIRTESEAMERAYAFFGVRPDRDWTLTG